MITAPLLGCALVGGDPFISRDPCVGRRGVGDGFIPNIRPQLAVAPCDVNIAHPDSAFDRSIFTMYCIEKPGWGFDWSKLEILLPMKLGCDHDATRDRAEFEWTVIMQISEYDIKVKVAHDLIRSKSIPVKLFADYLTELQTQAAEQGCVLTSSEDMMMEALMREVA